MVAMARFPEEQAHLVVAGRHVFGESLFAGIGRCDLKLFPTLSLIPAIFGVDQRPKVDQCAAEIVIRHGVPPKVSIFDENRPVKRQNTGLGAIFGWILDGVLTRFIAQEPHNKKTGRKEYFCPAGAAVGVARLFFQITEALFWHPEKMRRVSLKMKEPPEAGRLLWK